MIAPCRRVLRVRLRSISAGDCAGVDLTESIRMQDFYPWWRRWHDDRLSKLYSSLIVLLVSHSL